MFVYALPFGKGQHLASANRVALALVSGWQLSGVTTYRSGTGVGSIGAACNLPNAGGCFASYNPSFSGPVRINGDYGAGDLLGRTPPVFLDRNAFVSPPAYTFGNTSRTLVYGLRNPASYNQNVSVRRSFRIRESLGLTFQGDAINVFNWVNFSSPSLDTTSANFGRITGQSNLARVVQFNARVTFQPLEVEPYRQLENPRLSFVDVA